MFPKKIQEMSSLIVPKNLKEGTFWVFLTTIMLQNIKKKEGETFGDFRKFAKKVSSEKNGGSLVTTSAMRLAGTRGGEPIPWIQIRH